MQGTLPRLNQDRKLPNIIDCRVCILFRYKSRHLPLQSHSSNGYIVIRHKSSPFAPFKQAPKSNEMQRPLSKQMLEWGKNHLSVRTATALLVVDKFPSGFFCFSE